MIIIFDTETNGLPKNWNAPASDTGNWPRMIQLAWQHYSDDGRKLAEHNYIIKPHNWEVPDEVAAINGITTERAMKEGVELEYALLVFSLTLHASDTIVAHNIRFDKSIIGAEFVRKDMEIAHDVFASKNQVCTMLQTTEFCGIDGPRGKKWPKLIELHEKLFGVGFEGAHDALVDVQALAKCYFELKKLNVL